MCEASSCKCHPGFAPGLKRNGECLARDRDSEFPARLTASALAAAMPRGLIADGRAEHIARDWSARAAEAWKQGRAPIPEYGLDAVARSALFAARQARQLVRGLEGAESALDSQERGLSRAQATRPEANRRRISRLLIVSADGSPRFYRGVERLVERHVTRLEVIRLDCDEQALGEALFGPGRLARAVMLDHKEAVTRFLEMLDNSENSKNPENPDGEEAAGESERLESGATPAEP